MPNSKNTLTKRLIECFSKENAVLEFNTLLVKCNCSIRTLRRKIKKNNVISSYNKNSKYYTLPFLAEFNSYGIWHHEKAGFSKWGNLFQTISSLIDHSQKGYNSHELSEILGIRGRDSLRILSQKNKIKRINIQSQNFYFSIKKNSLRNKLDGEKILLKIVH